MKHTDKIKHFVVGFALSALGYFWWPLFSLGFIAGVVKEIMDSKFDYYDMLATWLGAAVAVAVLTQ